MLLATKKIQRTWRHNRGMAALSKHLECDCLEKLRQHSPETANPSFLIRPENIVMYKRWLLKLFIRAGLPNANELSSHHYLVVCWFVSVHKRRWRDEILALAADNLVYSLLEFLQCNYKQHIRNLGDEVQTFISVFTTWRVANLKRFNVRLRYSVIQMVYSMVKHTATPASELMPFRRLTALYAVMDPESRNLKLSPVYKSIIMASGNSLWAPQQNISHAKYVHALLHDSRFIVSVEKSIPELESRNTVGGQVVDSKALRCDVMSVIMGSVDDPESLERIANAFHEMENCQVCKNSFVKIRNNRL